MIRKLQGIIKSDLIKVSSQTGISTLVRIGASFIISKVLAIFVGPAGLAVMGQFNNLANILQSLSTGGITLGVTKYISEYADDKIKQSEIINNSIKVVLICSALCTLFVVLFYQLLGNYFFKNNEYNTILLILGLTLILFGFNSLIAAIVNGFKQFKLFVIINICTSIVSLIFTSIFSYFFGVQGALLSFVLSPAIVFFISWYLVRRQQWVHYNFLAIKTNKNVLKSLSRFALMAINNAVVGAIAQIAIRTFITGHMDLTVAGIWDGMNRLSAAYLLLITTSIQVYYLPTLSFIKNNKLLWKEIIKTEKIIMPITFLMFVAIFFCRGLIINVLFTKEFYLMKSVFALQLFGDFIKIASWIIAYTMYAKAMTKNLIITDNIFTFIYVAISYIFLNHTNFGLNSVYYAFILNNCIYLVFMYFFMRNKLLK